MRVKKDKGSVILVASGNVYIMGRVVKHTDSVLIVEHPHITVPHAEPSPDGRSARTVWSLIPIPVESVIEIPLNSISFIANPVKELENGYLSRVTGIELASTTDLNKIGGKGH